MFMRAFLLDTRIVKVCNVGMGNSSPATRNVGTTVSRYNGIKQRLQVHAAILAEIDSKRIETGNSGLFAAVEARIIRVELDDLQRLAALPVPVLVSRPVIRRGTSLWRRNDAQH